MPEVLGIILSAIAAALLLTKCEGVWPWRSSAGASESTATSAPFMDRTQAPTGTEPYGPGSHGPLPDNSTPSGYTIKGNADSMLYHRTDSRSYGVTIAEVWFDTAERAEAAGFTLANTHPS